MKDQIGIIDGKLKAWRLRASAQNPEVVVNEIYKGVFTADLYRDIWDESVLLGVQELVAQHPPDQEVFGPRLQFIKERTDHVVAINDLFAAVLFGTSEELTAAAGRIMAPEEAECALSRLKVNPAWDKIRTSMSQPRNKLAAFVEELAKQVPSISESLSACLEAVCARQEMGAANCMLITDPQRIGVVLPLQTMLQAGSGQVKPAVPTQQTFSSAVERARQALQSRGFLGTNQDVIFSANLTDATYSGSSITLGAAMAMYSSGGKWQFDSFTAFTGDINIKNSQWRISGVEGIPEKLSAARRAGIRRVVLPRQNQSDAPAERYRGLRLVFVDDINEVLRELTLPRDPGPCDSIQQRKISLLSTYSAGRGWQLSAPKSIQDGLQFTITPPTGNLLVVNVYGTGSHTPRQVDKAEFQDILTQLNDLDAPDTPLQSIMQKPFNITDAELRQQVKEQFEALRPSETRTEPYCDYSFVYQNGKEKLIVKQYGSGKLQLQGYAGPLYRRALEIIVPLYNLHFPNSTLNIADYLAPTNARAKPTVTAAVPETVVDLPHIGTDESGKGDYFGPLVVAGVWIDDSLQTSLTQLGVRDSKELSDRQCQDLASKLREVCQAKYQVVEISPEKYNELQEQFLREGKNLNHLLAWGHARVIESLLSRHQCSQAIADQFGDQKYIESKLMERGKKVNLLQTPKAERFIAVAAASILARNQFLSRLGQLSKAAGLALPKGASPDVIKAAREIVKARGPDALRRFAKLHFKTTDSVLARQ
jgi:ribonuclease HIII